MRAAERRPRFLVGPGSCDKAKKNLRFEQWPVLQGGSTIGVIVCSGWTLVGPSLNCSTNPAGNVLFEYSGRPSFRWGPVRVT
jgi:hypothetical protein